MQTSLVYNSGLKKPYIIKRTVIIIFICIYIYIYICTLFLICIFICICICTVICIEKITYIYIYRCTDTYTDNELNEDLEENVFFFHYLSYCNYHISLIQFLQYIFQFK